MPLEKLLPGNPAAFVIIMCALAAVPFFLMGVTSYVKLSVVFSILRNGLGAQQIPSAATTSLLALVLSLHIMRPVLSDMQAQVFLPGTHAPKIEELSLTQAAALWGRAEQPLLRFLARQSGERERLFFLRGAAEEGTVTEPAPLKCVSPGPGCLLPEEGLFSLIPAFLISQLREAFAFGFVIFLPLLVIDLVVANLLVALGLTMVSPLTLTLPLKILLFVEADSWLRLSQTLIASYS